MRLFFIGLDRIHQRLGLENLCRRNLRGALLSQVITLTLPLQVPSRTPLLPPSCA